MMYVYTQDQRFRQIETLLGYPKVGPLSPSAIAINLGTEEDTIQPDLDLLEEQGRLVRLRDGRFTVPGHAGQRDVPASQPGEGQREPP